ncbi:type II toxin-antitoxin system PemK/MazF family toxin [uncultured Tateyamaria sp.]|uniref:type II toxin-antitoxin system PemK/MazF family toxin n=1 Tax=uncultured Tateyamaria sp. TaxID=455651 RepID=UPI00260A8E1E|nr:type II toxin-antitoxin system PemK/MazF family toxin [uncultured Tateyamaria sp.]
MALQFHPRQGTIVLARFDHAFKEPEMVKTRLAVVVSKDMQARRGLCTIVPLSLSKPQFVMRYHCQIDPQFELPSPWGNQPRWVKGDMLLAAGFHRLDLLSLGKGSDGRRIYQTETISADDLGTIQACILEGLSLGGLTKRPQKPK